MIYQTSVTNPNSKLVTCHIPKKWSSLVDPSENFLTQAETSQIGLTQVNTSYYLGQSYRMGRNIRILDHTINQSVNLFIYGTIKLQKREGWESENFDWKLHLKKQIKIQLIQRHEHEH